MSHPTDIEKGITPAPPALHNPTTSPLPEGEAQWKNNIVNWDSPEDPMNPKNWPTSKKTRVTLLLGLITMCSGLSSAIFASTTGTLAKEYGVSDEVMILGSSLYMLGVPGPIIFAPLSEVFGRRTVLVPVFFFICFTAATATAENLQTIFITRFFSGLFASAPVTTVGGALGDLFDQRERATAVVLYSLAVVGGPTLAPVIGASVTNSYLGWRWTMYLVLILTSVAWVLGVLFVPETYAAAILTKKAAQLRRKTGRWELHSKHEEKDFSLIGFLESNLTRPIKMFCLEPMVTAVTLYNSFTYGVLYLLLAALPIIFEQHRHWTAVEAALPFLAILVGTLIAALLNLLYSLLVYQPYLDKHGNQAQPEMRLPPMMVGGVLFPLAFFLLGWTDPVGQMFGCMFAGVAFLMIFQAGINFFIDTYTVYAASAVASNTFVRSIFAAALPFSASALFGNLGIGWGCSLLGFLALLCTVIPFAFYRFGPKLRDMSRFAASAS